MANFKDYSDQYICDWTRQVYRELDEWEKAIDYSEDEYEYEQYLNLINVANLKLDILLCESHRRDIWYGMNTAL